MALPFRQVYQLPVRQSLSQWAQANKPTIPTSGPVANAAAAIAALTPAERMAALQAFNASAQAKIDEVWAKGTCSKAEMTQVVLDLCPFK